MGHALPLQEISSKSVHNFFSYPTDRQTDKQTDRTKDITSFGGGNKLITVKHDTITVANALSLAAVEKKKENV